MRGIAARLLLAGMIASSAGAALAENTTTTVYITGTLVDAPECTVNGNDQVDVNFGDDMITYQVDGTNYKERIVYDLECSSSLSKNGLTLTLNGTTASFGSGLLKTSNNGLGIRLLNDTSTITPGQAIKFNYGNQPVLYAVPVAQNASTLSTGYFSGTATMVIAYQ
jgi:type 1 fimbria pilin